MTTLTSVHLCWPWGHFSGSYRIHG